MTEMVDTRRYRKMEMRIEMRRTKLSARRLALLSRLETNHLPKGLLDTILTLRFIFERLTVKMPMEDSQGLHYDPTLTPESGPLLQGDHLVLISTEMPGRKGY